MVLQLKTGAVFFHDFTQKTHLFSLCFFKKNRKTKRYIFNMCFDGLKYGPRQKMFLQQLIFRKQLRKKCLCHNQIGFKQLKKNVCTNLLPCEPLADDLCVLVDTEIFSSSSITVPHSTLLNWTTDSPLGVYTSQGYTGHSSYSQQDEVKCYVLLQLRINRSCNYVYRCVNVDVGGNCAFT